MATATATPWLARYAPADETGRWIERTHAVAGWSAVTDGKFIIAVKDGGVMEWPPAERTEKEGERMRPFLDKEFQTAFTTTLQALWTFAAFIQMEPCESCRGHGTIDETVGGGVRPFPCPDCNDGYYSPTCGLPRPAFVADVLVSMNSLAYSLPPELAEIGHEVRVSGIQPSKAVKKASPGTAGTLYLEETSGLWRVVLMGLENPPNPLKRPDGWGSVPTFHPEPAFASLWLERGGDCVGVLADFLEEMGDPYAEVLRGGEPCH